MWGTSYSGFNSLQLACERPPALKAICAIYATDDRWTDDVHWRGGALRLVDLVDYCHYMTADVRAAAGARRSGARAGRDEWRRRLETHEPWVLTWLRENRHGAYWRHGSVRLDGDAGGYDRIACPVMIVAGWADGYRNNSFRTVAALAAAGVPHRLLAGPVGARRPDDRDARSADRLRRRAGRVVRPLAARPAGDPRGPAATCSCAPRTPPASPTWTCTRAGGSRLPAVAAAPPR